MEDQRNLSHPTIEEVESRLQQVIEILCGPENLNECIIPADAYELSEDINTTLEDHWQLPETISPSTSTDIPTQVELAKNYLLCLDPIGALTTLGSVWQDIDNYDSSFVGSIALIAQGILDIRKEIRSSQISSQWQEVISLISSVEHSFRFPPPQNRPKLTFHDYVLPKRWLVWGVESYIYLGKPKEAEFVLNELAVKHQLHSTERLWLTSQIEYCRGNFSSAITLLQELLPLNHAPVTRVLMKRMSLVQKLLNLLSKCDLSTDKGSQVFEQVAVQFLDWSSERGYDAGVRLRISELLDPLPTTEASDPSTHEEVLASQAVLDPVGSSSVVTPSRIPIPIRLLSLSCATRIRPRTPTLTLKQSLSQMESLD